jgi:hypothetical protein
MDSGGGSSSPATYRWDRVIELGYDESSDGRWGGNRRTRSNARIPCASIAGRSSHPSFRGALGVRSHCTGEERVCVCVVQCEESPPPPFYLRLLTPLGDIIVVVIASDICIILPARANARYRTGRVVKVGWDTNFPAQVNHLFFPPSLAPILFVVYDMCFPV